MTPRSSTNALALRLLGKPLDDVTGRDMARLAGMVCLDAAAFLRSGMGAIAENRRQLADDLGDAGDAFRAWSDNDRDWNITPLTLELRDLIANACEILLLVETPDAAHTSHLVAELRAAITLADPPSGARGV